MATNARRILFVFVVLLAVALATASVCFSLSAKNGSTASAADFNPGGQGTEAYPYVIRTADDLKALAVAVNNAETSGKFASAYYRIEISGNEKVLECEGTFTPIGTAQFPFNGNFDGNGVILSGLSVGGGDYTGLFGYIGASGAVTRVGISGGSVNGLRYTGGLAGYNAGNVSECFFDGSVGGEMYVGGLVGENAGVIANSFAKGSASASIADSYLGGVSGNNSGLIRYCYAQVDVEMTSLGGTASHVGAVTGNGSAITNSYYNTVSEPVFKAIGNESTGEDVVASNNVRGLSGKEMESNSVSVMFSTSAAAYWTRPSVFTLNNDTGYAAPLLKAFFETENNIESDIYGRDSYLAEAITIRMFGIGADTDFRQWGTQSNPYLIENETHLRNLSYVVNTYARTFADKYFLVSADIHMTSEFTPIGSVNNAVAFMGNFDGGSRVIYNLTIDTVAGEPDNAGLFGYLNGATVTNLALSAPSVTGVNYVGIVAGRSLNAVYRNIFVTDGKVTATGYGGGLVGSQNGGSVENVFLDVEMVSATTVPSATLYPVIGITEGTAPSPRTNIWYFAPVMRGGVKYLYITSEFGSGLVADDENAVEFSFAGEDAYAFTFTAEMPQGSSMTDSEFRRADESVVGNGVYTPAASANRETIYLRFTRTVSTALIAADSTASQYITATLSGETFYAGQEVTLSVAGLHSDKRANNNFYVESVKTTDALGQEVSGTVTGTPYRYDAVNHILSFIFKMRENVSEIKVNLNSLTKNNNETLQKIYDGIPAEYTSEAYACPDGFRIRYFYGTESNPTLYGESAPVNASASDSYYAVTVAYYNAYGIRVGSVQSLFKINKKTLAYTASADSTVPSVYWGDEGKVRISIRSEDISGLVTDDVEVFADVTFNDIELSVGTAKPVTFVFVLIGNSSNNYAAPDNYSGSVGVVEKRPVYVVPGSLTSVYNGAVPSAGEMGKINISNSVSAYPVTNSDLAYSFEPLNGIAAGDAGEYTLTVGLNDSASALKDCYEIYLKRSVQSDGVKELTFTVKPLEIVLNLATNGNVYTGKALSVISASAKGLGSDVFADLTGYLSVFDSAGEAVDEIVFAGLYTAVIDHERAVSKIPQLGNYTVKSCGFEILRAAQTATLLSGDHVVKAYSVLTGGAEFDLSEYFSSSAETENYVFEAIYAFDGDVSEDKASLTDGVLTVYGTGTVGVIFKAAGNANYFESDSLICKFEVVRRNVNLSIDDVSVKYGMPIVFAYTVTDADGDEQISYEQLGVTLTPTVSAEDPVCPVPGEYDITLEAGTLYSECFTVNVSDKAAKLTVVKRAVQILPDLKSAVSAYGEDIAEIGYSIYETVDGESVLAQDVALSGALSITGETVAGYYPVGEYPITTGSITAENPYYDVSFVDGDYVYTVTPARLSVYLVNSEKYFGEADPEPEWELRGLVGEDTTESLGISVAVTRDEGEDAVDASGNPIYYYYNVFVSGVPADGNYYYEQDAGYNAYLRILKAVPVVTQLSTPEVAAKSALDVDISAYVRAENASGEIIDGIFEWTEEFVADFKESAVLRFPAAFIPADPNYARAEFDVEVGVIPKMLSLNFTGALTYTYSGESTPDMTYTVSGADEGDELDITLEYTGDRINAGAYTVTASLGNKNYAFGGADSVKVTVEAAVVTVSFEKEQYIYTEGEEIDVRLVYSGFVAGEGKDVLTREATFTLISAPGEYTLRASGARADNYTFDYVSSSIIIYRSELVDEESGAVFTGKFPANVSVALSLAENVSEGNADKLYQGIKGAYNILSDKQLKSVYKIIYTGRDGYVNADEITIRLSVPEGASADTLQYLVVTNSGEILPIDGALYNEDGTVTLKATDAAYLLLAESVPEDAGGYILYIAIGAAVLVMVLIVVIAVVLKRRRNARFIQYHDE